MIEVAPKYKHTASSFKIMRELENSGELKKINDNYLFWDKIKYKKSEYDSKELWNAIKLSRIIQYKDLFFGKHIFNFSNSNYIQKTLHIFDMYIGGNLGAKNIISDREKQNYLITSIMEEAITSSQMEGANTTRTKAKEMLQKELKPKNKSEQMIYNNYETIKYIFEHKNEELSIENLLYIHKLISNKTLDNKEEEGKLRNNNNIVIMNSINSEIVYLPPKNEEINNLLQDLIFFFNNETEEFIHPIIKAIIIHFMLAWIHPFTDGNGRTARALFYWYLLKKGYWLTEYLSISSIIKNTKNQYEKAFLYTENDENDLTYFITYNLKVMEKAYESLRKYIERKQRKIIKAAQYLKIPNVNERQAQLIKILNEENDRIFTTNEIKNRFSVSDYTARTDLNHLVTLGLLDSMYVNKVKKSYIKSENFNSIIGKYGL